MKITRLVQATSTAAVAVLTKASQRRNDSVKKLLGLTLGMIAMAASSQASIILSLDGGTPTASGVNWSWNYTVSLSGDQNFRNSSVIDSLSHSSDVLIVFDFGGFVSVGWTALEMSVASAALSTQPTGPIGSVGGDSSVVNVVLRNNGPVILGGGVFHNLGVLNVISTRGFANALTGAYSAQAQKTADLGTTLNQGFLPVPSEPSGVPEPATFALIGGALIGLGFMRLRRA